MINFKRKFSPCANLTIKNASDVADINNNLHCYVELISTKYLTIFKSRWKYKKFLNITEVKEILFGNQERVMEF